MAKLITNHSTQFSAGKNWLGAFPVSAILELTSEDLLSVSEFLIVSSPGIGKIIVPYLVVSSYKFGSTPYIVPENQPKIRLGPEELDRSTDIAIMLYSEDTVDIDIDLSEFSGESSFNMIQNQPLKFVIPEALTEGDGTLKITVDYSIINI